MGDERKNWGFIWHKEKDSVGAREKETSCLKQAFPEYFVISFLRLGWGEGVWKTVSSENN